MGMADFVPEAPEAAGATKPTPVEDSQITVPSGGSKADWSSCDTMAKLYNAGYTYYKSSQREANGTKFQYTLEIKDINNKVAFTGKDANGNNIDATHTLGILGNQTYHVPNTQVRLTFKTTERGVINFRPANMNSDITLYLAKKSS